MTDQAMPPIDIKYEDEKHLYWIDGEEVPSVSTILNDIESKPALTWWGMRVGMAAIVSLMASHGWAQIANANTPAEIITPDDLTPERAVYGDRDKYRKKPKTWVELQAIKEKLTTNHIKEEAGLRGTNVHAVLEDFGVGLPPDPMKFPADQRGYVAALSKWWLDQEPEMLESEVIVGSREHRYAGRFDGVVLFHAGPYEGRRCLIDLKTSKSVYLSHLKQLRGYEVAYREMEAGDPFDHMLVIHANKHGDYNVVESFITEEHWVSAVQYFHEEQLAKATMKGTPGVLL